MLWSYVAFDIQNGDHNMRLMVFGAMALLAGCNGSAVDPVATDSFAAMQSDYSMLEAVIVGEPTYDPASFGTTGTATYSGVYFMAKAGDSDNALLGRVNVGVDFASDEMTSTVTGIYRADGTPMSGTLTGSGSLARAGSPDIFFPTHGGTVTGGGDTFAVSGSMDGEFRGAAGEYVFMSGFGNVSINGGPSEGISQYIRAEEQ